ncbi:MAG TPA: 2'-5' RNA ligase family protein [Bacilli bacterium]|nr:2'-5' RNA ligase family protein [Bacilli bacterium]
MKRAIHLFPRFENQTQIDDLRAQYDPLHALIPPHLTLVFPFDSDLSTAALEAHIHQAIQGIAAFPLELHGITGGGHGYLFLNVKRGNDTIIHLHDRLYTGPLRPNLLRTVPYIPHLTVGRFDPSDGRGFHQALADTATFTDTFTTTITELHVERIAPDDRSELELTIPLTTPSCSPS